LPPPSIDLSMSTSFRSSLPAGQLQAKVETSSVLQSLPEPRDKSDHVALLKWGYGRFMAGDFEALRLVSVENVQFLEPSDECVPKPRSSDIPWLRGSYGFEDFVRISQMMMGDVDFTMEILDIFMSPANPLELVAMVNCKAVGKASGKSAVFKTAHHWTLNDQHQIVKMVGYYDPIMWKMIL